MGGVDWDGGGSEHRDPKIPHVLFYSTMSVNTFEVMDELRELLEDLSDLGIKSCLLKGKDFGYGRGLQGLNDGTRKMLLTNEAVEWLIAQGHVEGAWDGGIYWTGFGGRKKRWNVRLKKGFCDTWKGMYLMSYVLIPLADGEHYSVMGSCGDSGFGSRSFQYELRPRSVQRLLDRLETRLLALTIGPGGCNPKL